MSTLLLLFSSLISCNNDTSVNGQDDLLGTWELVQFQDETTTTIMTDLDNSGPIVITFSNKEFEGNTGRNIFFGGYIAESKVLIFLDFFTSEVNESEWGRKLYDAIGSTKSSNDNNYHMSFIIEGNTLKMEYEPTRFMHFEKR
ncbi:MAG: hypothetical protein IIC74_07295 [Bacteroidetes bacterium]|nr:hypothetical protein [Bacteroidota bacterium]